jgi:hypothetical protein
MKNSKDPIGNQTRRLPAAPPRTSKLENDQTVTSISQEFSLAIPYAKKKKINSWKIV